MMTKADHSPETILVVDDEPAVRSLVRAILAAQGYQIVEAKDAESARRLAGEGARAVDLLLTDMVIPGMSGTALARELLATRPGLKVLYMSGFADPTPFGADRLGPGSHFLQKPFKPAALTAKVREVLGSS